MPLSNRLHTRPFASFALLGPLALSVPAFAASMGVAVPAYAQDSADELYQKGNELYRKSKWAEAYDAYSAAFALKQSYDIAGNLGDVALSLGKHREAAEHIAFALRNFPTGKPEARARAQERLSQAKKFVGGVTVKVNVTGATVRVNGRVVGMSPINHELYVEPGAVNVHVSAPGHGEERRTVALDKAETRAIEITLTPSSAATPVGVPGDQPDPAPASAAAPDPRSPSSSDAATADSGTGSVSTEGIPPKTIALIAGGALTAVGLGLGIVFELRRGSAADDASAARRDVTTKYGSDGCAGNAGVPECQELTSALERRDDSASLRTASFVGAGVFGAATLATWIFFPERSSSSSRAGLNLNVPRVMVDPFSGTAKATFGLTF